MANLTTNLTMMNGTMNNSIDQTNAMLLYISLLGLLGSLAVLLNGMLLFVLFCNKKCEFCSGTSYIIRNMALADCLTGVAVLIFICDTSQALSLFQLSMVWTTIEASVLSLMALSIERFIAFRYPFTWVSIVTARRSRMVSGLIWLVSIACGVAVYYYQSPTQFALTVVYEVCLVVFCILHGVIFGNLRERNRELVLFTRDISKVTLKAMKQSMNCHVTKVVAILIAVTTVTLLPYMIALQCFLWYTMAFEPRLSDVNAFRIYKLLGYFYPIELINFIVNPVIYAWRLKRYRLAFLQTFSRPLQCLGFVKSQRRGSTSTAQNGLILRRNTTTANTKV